MNPLHNALILSYIFDYLSVKDRKNFRLVNKMWRHETLDKWRKLVQLQITPSAKALKRFSEEERQNVPNRGIEAFYDLFHGPGNMEPFYNLSASHFRHFFMGSEQSFCIPPYQVPLTDNPKPVENKPQQSIQYVFEDFGEHMDSLSFDVLPIWSPELFLHAVKYLLLKACVNLKELSINYAHSPFTGLPTTLMENNFDNFTQEIAPKFRSLRIQSDAGLSYLTRHFVPELLNIIPNLEALTLGGDAVHFLDFLPYPLRNGNYIKLRNMTLDLQENHFPMLQNYVKAAKPPLTNMKIKISANAHLKPSLGVFHEILWDIRKTLKKLYLHFDWLSCKDYNPWIYELTCQKLPSLTHLRISSPSTEKEMSPHPLRFDFHSLAGFPKLEKLHISMISESYNEIPLRTGILPIEHLYYNGSLIWTGQKSHNLFVVPAITKLNHLKEFFFCLDERLDMEGLLIIANWMPYLEHLSIVADNETMPCAMNIWRRLKKFNLLLGSNVDKDFVNRTRTLRDINIENIDCYKMHELNNVREL